VKYARLALLSCYPGKNGRKLASELVLWQRNIRLRYVFSANWDLILVEQSSCYTQDQRDRCWQEHTDSQRQKVDFLWTSFLFVSIVLLFAPSKTMLLFKFLYICALRVPKRLTGLDYDGTLDGITLEPFRLLGLMWN
jgi:hypothetical protein